MRCLLAALLLITFALAASGQEWTRFRGPNGAGVSDATTIPVTWTARDELWKTALRGVGHSSPVVWGDKVFVTAGDAKTGKRLVQCVSSDKGAILWTREFDAAAYKMHKRNSIATSTPAVDTDRLYLAWGTPERVTMMALDHQGELKWQTDLGPFKSQHGFGASPVVVDGLVILQNDQDGGGAIVALDAATGKKTWELPRKPKNATYSTPCLYQPAGQRPVLIFTNWQHGMTAVDPKTGKMAWEISVFEVNKQERSIASPVIAGDLILGTCGFVTAQKHFVAIRPPAKDGDKPVEVWRLEKKVSYLPTPLVKGDRIYLCSEEGFATCLDVKTGKQIWQERIGDGFSASPVCAGDRIYCVSNDGVVVTLAASDTFHVLGQSALGEPTQSTPAISGGRMFLRTEGHLVAVGKK
jgi:outer membrane protein assembly factor BamB